MQACATGSALRKLYGAVLTSHADQLALPHAEGVSSFADNGIQPTVQRLDLAVEVHSLEDGPQCAFGVQVLRVKVEFDCAREKYWVLWAGANFTEVRSGPVRVCALWLLNERR